MRVDVVAQDLPLASQVMNAVTGPREMHIAIGDAKCTLLVYVAGIDDLSH